MKVLNYQEKAVKRLIEYSEELLNDDQIVDPTVVFESPTGSGKTFIVSDYIKQMTDLEFDISYIWVAPRALHSQSKNKLEEYFVENKYLKCSFFQDLMERRIDKNEILFLNWESINKEDNIIYRRNETENYLGKVIENTKNLGRKIILILDESHHSVATERSQELIDLMDPDLGIAVSATPKDIGQTEKVTVRRSSVIQEEMIKQEIVINEGTRQLIEKETKEGIEFRIEGDSTNQFVLDIALSKREDIKKSYENLQSQVNPLMLIQLPDSKRSSNFDLKNEIENYLEDEGITIENGKLAIWLSEQKENLSNIDNNFSQVDVLIFKQAIALGWDCPRASILVTLRDHKSFEFSTQTIGRITRMPEQKHYNEEILNKAYVYTNGTTLSIHRDIARGYTSFLQSRIKQEIDLNHWASISLPSFHVKRSREKTRLDSTIFPEIFELHAKNLEIKSRLNLEDDELSIDLLSDSIVNNPANVNISDLDVTKRGVNPSDLQNEFDSFIALNLEPLYPEVRSINRIKNGVYRFFEKEFNLNFAENQADMFRSGFQYSNEDKVKRILLSKSNYSLFEEWINNSIQKYVERVAIHEREFIDNEYKFKEFISYSNLYHSKEYKLSFMEPFYELLNASKPEKDFAKFLNKQKGKIIFFHKNGDSGKENFAVKHSDNYRTFYVDWIIKFIDGRLGLFDTKSGRTAESAKERAEGLYNYIEDQNKNGKNLIGGIVIPIREHWWVNSNKEYNYTDDLNLIKDGWVPITKIF